jgi:hypothetical protein
MQNSEAMPVAMANDPAAVPCTLSAFRIAFLTASTWAQSTATPTELDYAIANWQPGQSVAFALSRLQSRRALDRRGLLRKQEREAKEAADRE